MIAISWRELRWHRDSLLASVRREIPQKLATHTAISWSYEQTLTPIFPSLKQAKAEYVKIGAGFQQVSGEAVAEHVGINLFLDAGTTGGMLAGVARSLGIDGLIAAVPAVAGKQPDAGSFPQLPPPSGTP